MPTSPTLHSAAPALYAALVKAQNVLSCVPQENDYQTETWNEVCAALAEAEDVTQRERLDLESAVLSTVRQDPSLIHRMPRAAWDAVHCVVDERWRFLSGIGSLRDLEAQRFARWYAGFHEGVMLMHRACGSLSCAS